ncbi:MAG: transglutaminase domain-containing protein, partial [Proteobacteria bacterium]
MISWLLAAALSLAGTSIDAPPSHPQVMEVPRELQDQWQVVLEGGRNDQERLRRLLDFLADTEHGLAMKYRDDATLTVTEAYRTRQANCLTYTMLFIALAHFAGLDAYPQEIDETLAWQQRDGIVYRTNHVNAGVRVGTRRYTVDVGSSFVMARHPAHRITPERLLAQYYN